MAHVDTREVKELLRRATETDPYGAFESAYRAVVVAAHRSTLNRENARLQRLVADLPETTVEEALSLPDVDILLNLDPPLETYAELETEKLSGDYVARCLRELRRHRVARPGKAARALMEVLGFIRGKQLHGYKRVFQHRDYTILKAAAAITLCLGRGALELLDEDLAAGGDPSSGSDRSQPER